MIYRYSTICLFVSLVSLSLIGCGGGASFSGPAPQAATQTESSVCRALPANQQIINHTGGSASDANLIAQWQLAQQRISVAPGVDLNAVSGGSPNLYVNPAASGVQPDCAVVTGEPDVPVATLEQQFSIWNTVCSDPNVNYSAHPKCLDPTGTFIFNGSPVAGVTIDSHAIVCAQSVCGHAGWIVNGKTKVLDPNSLGAVEYEAENAILMRLGASVEHR